MAGQPIGPAARAEGRKREAPAGPRVGCTWERWAAPIVPTKEPEGEPGPVPAEPVVPTKERWAELGPGPAGPVAPRKERRVARPARRRPIAPAARAEARMSGRALGPEEEASMSGPGPAETAALPGIGARKSVPEETPRAQPSPRAQPKSRTQPAPQALPKSRAQPKPRALPAPQEPERELGPGRKPQPRPRPGPTPGRTRHRTSGRPISAACRSWRRTRTPSSSRICLSIRVLETWSRRVRTGAVLTLPGAVLPERLHPSFPVAPVERPICSRPLVRFPRVGGCRRGASP